MVEIGYEKDTVISELLGLQCHSQENPTLATMLNVAKAHCKY